jgi:hypothetical protein
VSADLGRCWSAFGSRKTTPTSYTLHPPPSTLQPTPYTLHPPPTPYTLHPAPYILHPHPTERERKRGVRGGLLEEHGEGGSRAVLVRIRVQKDPLLLPHSRHMQRDPDVGVGVSSRGVGGFGHGYNSLRKPAGRALKVKKLTFTIRASDSSWHPGLPGRPLSPHSRHMQRDPDVGVRVSGAPRS